MTKLLLVIVSTGGMLAIGWFVWQALKAQEAFLGLTQRFPAPVVATDELEYHPAVVSRALKALRVEF